MGIYGTYLEEISTYLDEGIISKIANKKSYKDNKHFVDDCIRKSNDIIDKKDYCKMFNSPEFNFDFSKEFRVYIGSISILKLYKYVYKEDPKKAGERGGKYPKLKEELENLESIINDTFENNKGVKCIIDYMNPENYFMNWDDSDWLNLYEELQKDPYRDTHDNNVCPDIILIFKFK